MPRAFQKLTRPVMRRLPPGGKLNEHGITFERHANGDGIFTVNIMVDGQRIHRVIGRESDGVTRKQAEDFIEKARRDAREGRWNLPKGRKVALGFRKAANQYLERLEEEGGNDLVMKERRLRIHLVPFWGDKPLSSISSFDLERYKKNRVEQGAKVGTINRELACLSHLFNKAVEWKWLDKRPVVIKRFKEDAGRIIYLTTEQSQRLLDAAKADFNPQLYPFIYIGLRTGMRKMEILGIRIENIDTQRKTIYVPTAKAGAREQPITHDLANYLDTHMHTLSQGSCWLFPSPKSKTGHTVEVRKAFRRVAIAAGLNPDEVVRHTLRHTAVSHLVQAGVDLPTVKRISGHKTLAMVEKYAHQSGNHIQSAMDQLEARYTNFSDTITPKLHKAENTGKEKIG